MKRKLICRFFTCFCLLFSHVASCVESQVNQGYEKDNSSSASSESVAEQTGVFLDTVTIGALDKVTARTSKITFRIGEPKKIGTLIVKALRAWKSNPEEKEEAKVFFDVVEQKSAKSVSKDHTKQAIRGTIKTKTEATNLVPVFQGWMFQSNRSISSIDHPVYDFWVLDVSGNPHDGIMLKSDTFIDEVDMNSEIHELIDQLMDEDVHDPIAIEPNAIEPNAASAKNSIPDHEQQERPQNVSDDPRQQTFDANQDEPYNKNLVRPDADSNTRGEDQSSSLSNDSDSASENSEIYDVDEDIIGKPIDELDSDQENHGYSLY